MHSRWAQHAHACSRNNASLANFSTSRGICSNELYDVFIVGGGVVGSTLAKLLKEKACIPLRIGLLDAGGEPSPLTSFVRSSHEGALTPLIRSYALSPASLLILGLRPGGVVSRIRELGRASDYDKMQVWESDGPGNLRFTSSDLSNHSEKLISAQGILGSMMEDALIVSAIWDELKAAKVSTSETNQHSIDLYPSCSVTSIRLSRSSKGHLQSDHMLGAEVAFSNKSSGSEHIIRTRLLVAADGGNSFVRKALNIPHIAYEYGRTAVTTTVKLQSSSQARRRDNTMQHTAFQRFFPSGPVALLPMWDKGEYANVVWSTNPEHAAELLDMTSTDFVGELNKVLQSGPVSSSVFNDVLSPKAPNLMQNLAYGVDMLTRTIGEGLTMARWNKDPFQIPPYVHSVCGNGKRIAFPLSMRKMLDYSLPNLVLVGDAAHTLHPMAGQGLNMGLADVACLTKHIVAAQNCGMDIGDTYILDMYQKDRQRAVISMMGGIHALHTAFSMEAAPAKLARSVGLNVTNSLTPLRQTLANFAAGNSEVL